LLLLTLKLDELEKLDKLRDPIPAFPSGEGGRKTCFFFFLYELDEQRSPTTPCPLLIQGGENRFGSAFFIFHLQFVIRNS